MSNKIVSIVIVTAGSNNYLASLMKSLQNQTYKDPQIIIVDNSNNAEFNRFISQTYPEVILQTSPKNLFYCEALNIGINLSKGEFVLCLNDDVILDKDYISETLKGFFIDEKIGAVSGKILRSDGKTIDSTGLFLSRLRTAAERGYGSRDTGKFVKQEYIFGVNGAVAFYRKKMLEQIKLEEEYFDSDFRIFFEDLDIAWRGQNFGWRSYYMPRAVAYHTRGGTVRSDAGLNKRCARVYLNDGFNIDLVKNRYLAIVKNDRWPDFFLNLPLIFIYDLFAYAYIIIFRPGLLKKMSNTPGLIKRAFIKRHKMNRLRKLLSVDKP